MNFVKILNNSNYSTCSMGTLEPIYPIVLRIKKKSNVKVNPSSIETGCNPIPIEITEVTRYSSKLFNIQEKYFIIPPENEQIITVLEALIQQIKCQVLETDYQPLKRTHQFRALSIQKACIALRKYSEPIINPYQLESIRGIGDGVIKRISEIIRTGSLLELNYRMSPFVKAVEELTKIHGIGEDFAKKLISRHQILNITDLRRKLLSDTSSHGPGSSEGSLNNLITNQVRVGLKYFEDIQSKIPYNEVAEMKQYLRKVIQIINPVLKIKICGSHRRKKPMSKDIDVLLLHPGLETSNDLLQSKQQWMQIIITNLMESGFITDTITYGLTKFLGIARWKGVARRIDIIWIPRDSYVCSLLYFTGSDILNRVMRTVALRKGYSLNNYGIYPLQENCRRRRYGEWVDRTVNYKTNLRDEKAPKQYITGEKLPVKNEREVFELLDLEYLRPEQRG